MPQKPIDMGEPLRYNIRAEISALALAKGYFRRKWGGRRGRGPMSIGLWNKCGAIRRFRSFKTTQD